MTTSSEPSWSAPQPRTAPELKWLLNERAAIAGVLVRRQERCANLLERLVRAEKLVESLRMKVAQAQAQTKALEATLAAFDRTLDHAHPNVAPDALGPVNGWAGRYGERGALKRYVAKVLEAAAPLPVEVRVLYRDVATHFRLDLQTPGERERLRDSVKTALRALRDGSGVVESIPDQTSGAGTGWWRWKPAPTITDLRALAQASDEPDPNSDELRSEVARQ